MKISLQKALSLFLTGSLSSPETTNSSERSNTLADEELAEMEMTRTEWDNLTKNSFKFKDSTLAQQADWDTLTGYIRNAELSMFDSLFSGIGAGFAKSLSFISGLGLASLSIALSTFSTIKKTPYLSTNFSFSNFGGRLVRAKLRFLDSIFSSVGEKGASLKTPSLLAGLVSLLSLNRVMQGKDDKSIEMPYATIGGTLGRTAIHHMESMLASKANELSSEKPSLAAFLASTITTLGLLAPKEVKGKKVPVETLEGLLSLVGPHFLDSLFTNIGNIFSPIINKPKNLLLSIIGFSSSLPILASIPKFWNHKASVPELEGKLIRSAFGTLDTIAFNSGNSVGNSKAGIPTAFGFLGLTYLACVSKQGEKALKNFKIPMNTVGSLFQRLPFDFIYSLISTAGNRLSKLIPAPLLVLLGPSISFKLSEQFKGINAKYDNCKGLMIRNAVHLWETILASAAYRTGKMISGNKEDSNTSGSLLGERWITDDGQIVLNMAIGKQIKQEKEKNILPIVISALGGIAFAKYISLPKNVFVNKREEQWQLN